MYAGANILTTIIRTDHLLYMGTNSAVFRVGGIFAHVYLEQGAHDLPLSVSSGVFSSPKARRDGVKAAHVTVTCSGTHGCTQLIRVLCGGRGSVDTG